eukprot:scaffold230571_cov35-Tisochrysis_lutea.AAC.3
MAKTALAYAKKASYIGKKVVVAVKASGDGDPNSNRALAAVMREANALDVPKDVVDRNIKKALDPVTADYKELTYEAYACCQAAAAARRTTCSPPSRCYQVLSDNNNRAVSDIGTVLKKAGCKVATPGSVTFNFARKGRLCLSQPIEEEKLIDLAALQDVDIDCSGSLIHLPLAPVEVSEEDEEANYACIDKLEELDDVTNVEHNMA